MAILSESNKVHSGFSETEVYKLLSAKADVNTASDAIDILDAVAVTLYVESSSGTASGVVTLETAMTSDFSGTWGSIGTVTTNAATKVFTASAGLGNESSGAGLPQKYVRARISTVIGSGTVDVYLIVRRN